MNLLIEQRPTTITSSKSQQHQQSQISNENDMNNSSSSSPLVLKIKRHTTKQQQQQNNSISTSSHMLEDDNNSRSTTNNQRFKRTSITNTTATRRPSSPAFNGKQQQQQQQQATKRSVTIDNNNNDLTGNIDDISLTKRFKRDDSNHLSSSKVDACVETVSIGLATEPDHLGPCEPGTSVVLEGIVWNETDSGVLVVNVTWRGKTYVGTLLDSTKQDWACPRLTCESPTSDYDARSSSKTSRTKRTAGAGGNTRCSNPQQQSVSLCQQISSNNLSTGLDERKLRNNIKSRQSKRLNNISTSINDEIINNSSPLTSPYRTNNQQTFFASETPSPTTTATTTLSSNLEPQLISCSESHCHKRFASNIALSYHLSDAHKKTDVITPTIPQANTRDEEDVAHILANVADYVRRSSPPSSKRCSPEHHMSSSNLKTIENSSLSWPCPQISSKLVLSASLNNAERILSPNSPRCKLNNNETTLVDNQNRNDHDDLKTSVKQADHFLLHIKDEVNVNKNSYLDLNIKKEQNIIHTKIPTPPPISSSPAYSDISDEDLTPNEQILPQPSTINLLTATNGKIDENGNNLHPSSSFLSTNNGLNNSNSSWTAQMLFQQFGSFIQPQTTVSNNKDLSTTPNRLNSNNNICPSSNGTSDSTVKNILDSRRSSTTKSSSSSSTTNLYHYHTNETKFPTPIINTLTSPNENLLHLSSTTTIKPMDLVDYSINNNRTTNGGQYHHSSSLHPSRIINGQQYVIKRDFRASYQYNSFSVFTNDEYQLIYRIETQYSLSYAATIKSILPLDDFIIVAHIDAFLGSNRIFNFRILNSLLGRWIDGRIYQQNMLIYVIELINFQKIIIELSPPHTPEMSSLNSVRFRDGQILNKIFADYTQRTPWLSIYDLRLFSNEYPIELYLVGFAIVQRRM
ncbi:unnamed protein product [Rotaria sp. Silwood1]|nr:unnamed protein product [Rotaria sp. Silwood1]CAF0739033.1 unnamed protein product [Rotaria sp. Silwood1]CAF3327322.1 unnamed protein product [Rotaria sp. Silwood1]CAF3349177.1 unnamed protein product [Rotaria sp. Silwood1]CAF4537986.1 unnamed protein product [Rotaria sp. Silwood1]